MSVRALGSDPPALLSNRTTQAQQSYNGVVTESLKVDKERFETVIKALLNTPPMPASDIPRKREPKAKKPKAKKRS